MLETLAIIVCILLIVVLVPFVFNKFCDLIADFFSAILRGCKYIFNAFNSEGKTYSPSKPFLLSLFFLFGLVGFLTIGITAS